MSITENLVSIKNRIAASAARTGRDPAGITLIAVTKYVGMDPVNQAIAAGVTDIGENRVQDGQSKFPLLVGKVNRHLIGSLQTNKVKNALQFFDLIHSVDRPDLIHELAKQASKLNRRVEFLIQLNISGEVTKHGLHSDELPVLLQVISGFDCLIPCGLMTIAPLDGEAEAARPIFRHLKILFDEAARNFNLGKNWRYLSMGMSQDFEVAVEEGANLLRIGTAIFTSK
jgi:PLP dependent protein